MLVLMTLTHLPTRLTTPLGQPFGFVSAAEGFVLLSGFMAGLVYGRTAQRRGLDAMRRAFWRRSLLVYGCHAALLLFLFTVIAVIGLRADEPAVKNLMRFYLEQPVDALLGGLLLIYQPPLLDILPMYVLFMLASPWAFWLALRFSWVPVLAGSLSLWWMAQFGLAEWLYAAVTSVVALPVPYPETGAFNSFAWQLLWILGLWMGASRNESPVQPFRFPPLAVAVALLAAGIGLVWRHAVGQAPFGANESLNLLFDKWQLAPLRLLNLLALVLLVIHFGPRIAQRLPRLRALETLGAASLPVFCAHLIVVLLVLALFGAEFSRPWMIDAPLLAVCLGSLYGAGRLTQWWEARSEEPAPLARPSGPGLPT